MIVPSFFQNVWLIPCYSLIGAILTVPWSPGFIRKTGSRPAGYINILMTLLSFVHALVALSASWNQPAQHIVIPWLNVASLNISIPIEISSLTLAAIVLITGLNLLAQIYAIGYMEMDWGWARFYGLMALFEGGMCALVLCDSLFCSYVILEILTLGTYLLVGLWFSQPMVVTGARDAFLTKRVGDLFLLMGVLALYPLAGTWNFTELATWAQTANLDPKVAALLGLALIAGPMSKCAQFPLHLWLDEAMEGPIPSTILRNSVVVATGAWVLVKLEPVIALSPVALGATIFIGGLTAVGGSLIAIAQIDIKRALSYSVSAYMGLIFIAVGTGQTEAALLLVLTHAIAMALLYIVIGGVIWNSITQDLTKLGGIWSRRPLSGLAFLVGIAGLIALPPFGSFWAMLKLADGLWSTQPWLVGLLLTVNSLTAFSLTRVFGLIFAGKEKPMTVRSPEVGWQMVMPMMLLVGFTLHLPLVLQSLSLLPDWANVNKDVALLLIWSSIFGCSLSAVIYVIDTKFKPQLAVWKPLQNLLAYDFYTPKLYRFSIVFAVDSISKITAWFDQHLIDGVVNFVGFAAIFSGQGLRYNVSGQSQFYVLTIILGMTLFLGLLTIGAIH
ncbi:NAD(P)H dehydrogenase, subunit NdhF3 family [Crinalium epipsammum PCC 9333]|uniref:NAD(P)H dehydrogenase, subunit NdhF3 family n=1 Tax=Crinalium epipsammum PCC 9333 TaxID=1173022 RepID=K9W531_9CYAN|nr:NAD(P)H-quinone oxidoreductase subunit F [Crinalium epipsammum]AFZ14535.1 NAD(P)H dehydrogenase, subunit NdhF3 family [Crinalium epipsammum PCC 9333]